MRKYIITSVLPLVFAFQAIACGEKTSAAMQNLNHRPTEAKVCPSAQKVCPAQCPSKAGASSTQAVLASNREAGSGMCNTTRVALSMMMGLGLIFGLTLLGGKAKI